MWLYSIYLSLLSRFLNYFIYYKTPETEVSGVVFEFNILLSNMNYSMMEATRPDPTVRPPSRYQTDVLRCANGDFSCDLCEKIRIFRCVRVVFLDFVIMVLS